MAGKENFRDETERSIYVATLLYLRKLLEEPGEQENKDTIRTVLSALATGLSLALANMNNASYTHDFLSAVYHTTVQAAFLRPTWDALVEASENFPVQGLEETGRKNQKGVMN